MGRKRKSRAMDIYFGSTKAGIYARTAAGATSFRYDDDWLASGKSFPISLSLPLSGRIWTGDAIDHVFSGLLPDDQKVRETIAARTNADSAGTFDLLAAIGRDCAGAMRFIPEGNDPGAPDAMAFRVVDDNEISRRIDGLADAPLGMKTHDGGEDEDFRISIAGMQEKTGFLYSAGGWRLPLGGTPTSHIFKPALRARGNGLDFSDSPWNEWFCLKLCEGFGLASANAEVRLFGGNPVIIVERFDRQWRDGVLYRLPQEDLCQALGVKPDRKYECDGGPGILDILEFLNRAAYPRNDRLAFLRAQIVFWLLAATDGHAKNFSVFLTPGGFGLTPLYDVISMAPYPDPPPQKIKLSMAVGDNRHYRHQKITPRHFHQTGRAARIAKEDVDEIFDSIAASANTVLDSAVNEAECAGMPEKTRDAIVERVRTQARLASGIY